jgi:hypothetical protein
MNTSLTTGLAATRSRLPPNGTKPDRSGLTATSRGSGWRVHCGVEVIELSSNKQHTLSAAHVVQHLAGF